MFFTKEEINFDLQAVIMLLGAGISYLVIRSNHIDVFGGLELNSDEGWKRMEKAFENIIHGILKNRQHIFFVKKSHHPVTIKRGELRWIEEILLKKAWHRQL